MTATYDPFLLADLQAQSATELLSLHDGDGRFLTASAASEQILGVDADDLLGRSIGELVHPEDARTLETAFAGAPGEPRSGAVSATCRLRHGEGYWTWVEVTTRPAPGGYGVLDGATVASIRDAGELVAARQAAQWADETLRQVFDGAPAGIAMIGLDGRLERVNPAFCSLLDAGADQLLGRNLSDFVEGGESPADRFALTELVSGRLDQVTGSLQLRRAGRAPVTASVRRSMGRSVTGRQHVVLHVLAVRDEAPLVPSQTRSEPESARGPVDVLDLSARPREPRPAPEGVTGLTSRALLLDRLTVAAARPERETHFLVLFFVDVADTQRILDRHGRRTLEGVLGQSGNRLRAMVRSEDTVARFGDRGFVVLCPTVSSSADVVSIRKRLAHAVADGPIIAEGRKFKVHASVGAAIVGPREACNPDELLARADAALPSELPAPARR